MVLATYISVMPKVIPEEELMAILAVVMQYPNGVSGDIVRRKLSFDIPPRMFQRRLAVLIERGKLIAKGRGRGSRYWPPKEYQVYQPPTAPVRMQTREPGDENYPLLSSVGREIREKIQIPILHRTPVGFDREFLDAYRPNETWYLTEEIRHHLWEIGQSREEQRPAGTYARQIYNRLLIDLSWNSSRLEGNTYSLLETERLLALGESAVGRDARESQMILNHKAAIELLVDQADEVGFNRYTLLNLHALLSENLLEDPDACGRLRTIPVGVAGTVYLPLEVPQIIEEVFQQILDTATAIRDPYEQAFFIMVHLPYLQPFEDVNKRVSRLAANVPLIRGNLCPLSFVDVPEQAYIDGIIAVYELNRIELLRDIFVWAYERSCARYSAVRRSLGQPNLFKLRYREQIASIVADIVRQKLDKKAAAVRIRNAVEQQISPVDQARFMEIVEIELMSLHEGNFARFRLRPAEFEAWQKGWT